MQIPQVDLSTLAQKAETFYDRLKPAEEAMIRKVVQHIQHTLPDIFFRESIVAGVGGILRYNDPFQAKDIDLAVIGPAYTSGSQEHTFDHVIDFTSKLVTYFDLLTEHLRNAHGAIERSVSLRKGSGPMFHIDREMHLSRNGQHVASLESEFASFGWYNSKGLQIALEGIRPIDIQFVFNRSFDNWKEEQEHLTERPGSTQISKLPLFFYAVL
jgi:hypothetical protein